MQEKMTEASKKEKAAKSLANQFFDLDKRFESLKSEVKTYSELEKITNKKTVILDLTELYKLVNHFIQKNKKPSKDYEIESTKRIYSSLKMKMDYAVTRTRLGDYSWAYLE